MIRNITQDLVVRLLQKTMRNYSQKYKTKLPMIAVVGSVGKSSQTQLIADLFHRANFKVLSSKKNTINGLGMILGEFDMSFEGKFSIVKKIEFILTILYKLFFYKIELPQKSILVLEVGFDHQGEAEDFKNIFEGNLDTCVITALTDEHNLNYSSTFDTQELRLLKNCIPEELYNKIMTSNSSESTKNVIVEMLKPLQYTKSSYIAFDINKLSNSMYVCKEGGCQVVTSQWISNNESIVFNNMVVDSNYLLPLTFAKTLDIVDRIARDYNLENVIVKDVLAHLSLPKGRFSKLKGKSNTTIIDSSYNSDPDSLIGFLKTLDGTLKDQSTSEFDLIRHNVVLGEMRELGDIATTKHQLILDMLLSIKAKHYDKLESITLLGQEWLKCDDTDVVKSEGHIRLVSYKDVIFKTYLKAGDILRDLQDNIRPLSWFWIKGSQNTIFLEILVEGLLLNDEDKILLCRQEKRWYELRKDFE
jgi:Mur ligase middle domain